MTMDLVKKGFVLFVVVLTLMVNVVQVNAAATVPSIEITGPVQNVNLPNICANGTGTLSFEVPTWENFLIGSSNSALVSVAGVGIVGGIGQNAPANRNQADVYTLGGMIPYNVGGGTLVTITITSFFGPAQSGGTSYISTIVTECDNYTNNVITNVIINNAIGSPGTPTAGAPTMNEWGMIIFMVLAGLGAIYFIRRKRAVS